MRTVRPLPLQVLVEAGLVTLLADVRLEVLDVLASRNTWTASALNRTSFSPAIFKVFWWLVLARSAQSSLLAFSISLHPAYHIWSLSRTSALAHHPCGPRCLLSLGATSAAVGSIIVHRQRSRTCHRHYEVFINRCWHLPSPRIICRFRGIPFVFDIAYDTRTT